MYLRLGLLHVEKSFPAQVLCTNSRNTSRQSTLGSSILPTSNPPLAPSLPAAICPWRRAWSISISTSFSSSSVSSPAPAKSCSSNPTAVFWSPVVPGTPPSVGCPFVPELLSGSSSRSVFSVSNTSCTVLPRNRSSSRPAYSPVGIFANPSLFSSKISRLIT